MGYTKLFTEIIMSTVWREPDHVRLLWITMLALKDRWHIVNASLPGLADSARITIPECEEALKILASPDPHSRTKDHDGCRIEACDGGWVILNGEKYRNKMSLDERREYQRIKQREYRQKKKEHELSTSCQQSSQQLTHTDTDTEALKQTPKSYDSDFLAFWEKYPRKEDKKKASVSWRRLSQTKKEKALKDIETRYSETEKKFIPMPTTYINGERWDDEKAGNEQGDQFAGVI